MTTDTDPPPPAYVYRRASGGRLYHLAPPDNQRGEALCGYMPAVKWWGPYGPPVGYGIACRKCEEKAHADD